MQPQRQPDQHEDQQEDADCLVDQDERQIFRRDRGDHADANEQHGEDADRHQPVQNALDQGKTMRSAGHGLAVSVRG